MHVTVMRNIDESAGFAQFSGVISEGWMDHLAQSNAIPFSGTVHLECTGRRYFKQSILRSEDLRKGTPVRI